MEECLERYPQHRRKLEVLLDVARSIRPFDEPGFEPDEGYEVMRRRLERLARRRRRPGPEKSGNRGPGPV